MRRLFVFIGFVVFVSFSSFAINKNLNQTDFNAQVAGAATEENDELLNLINEYRLQNDAPKLQLNDDLKTVAEMRTLDMLNRQYYSHTNPDGLKYNAYFQGNKGYSCENLNLLVTDDLEQTVYSWLGSESHRKCLLDSRLNNAGYAVADMGDNYYLTTLIISER